jgi:hypothetical protein
MHVVGQEDDRSQRVPSAPFILEDYYVLIGHSLRFDTDANTGFKWHHVTWQLSFTGPCKLGGAGLVAAGAVRLAGGGARPVFDHHVIGHRRSPRCNPSFYELMITSYDVAGT